MTFQDDSGVTPDLTPLQVGAKLVASGVLAVPGLLKPIGYLVHWKRDYMSVMLRSMVALTRGAGGYILVHYPVSILAQVAPEK